MSKTTEYPHIKQHFIEFIKEKIDEITLKVAKDTIDWAKSIKGDKNKLSSQVVHLAEYVNYLIKNDKEVEEVVGELVSRTVASSHLKFVENVLAMQDKNQPTMESEYENIFEILSKALAEAGEKGTK